MNTSSLYPPNFQYLTEDIIADVVQRVKRPTFATETGAVFSDSPLRTTPLLHARQSPATSTVAHRASAQPTQHTQALQRNSHASDHKVNAKAAEELRRRRERNRVNQARYKMRQNLRATKLATSTQQLHKEIAELRMHRHIVTSMNPATNTIWSIAVEYLRLFRFGVQAPEGPGSPNTAAGALRVHDARVQQNATTTPDLTDGTFYSIEAFMQSWMQMSVCIPNLDIQLVQLENGPRGSLIATVEQNVTVTRDMLYFAFPNLFADQGFHLPSKLLGQQFVLRALVVFDWDDASNRVCGIQFKTDLLTPMLRILGSLEDVSKMFENARLTPECGLSMD